MIFLTRKAEFSSAHYYWNESWSPEENLRVFGSVARGQDRPDSDVDLLADLPPSLGLLGLGRLQEELESVLGGVRIDLVPAPDLKPDVRSRVEHEAVAL